jgi:hypothetical protein
MLWPFAPAFNTEDEVRDAALYFSNFPATQQVHIFAAFSPCVVADCPTPRMLRYVYERAFAKAIIVIRSV